MTPSILLARILSACDHCGDPRCTSPLCAAWMSAERECERQRIKAARRVMTTRIDFAEFCCAVARGGVD